MKSVPEISIYTVPKSDIDDEKSKIVNFEEALRRTEFGKFNYILVILSGMCLSTVLLETLGISFVMPIAECDLNLSTEDKGLLSAIAFAGIIASSHLWGYLADTRGRKKVMMPSLFISCAITIVSSFIKTYWIFTMLRFFSGFFVSGASATIYAYLGEFHSVKTRSRVLMGAAFVFGVCCLCLPLLAFLVINHNWHFYISFIDVDYKPWRLFIVVCGSMSALCGISFLFLPESPKFVFSSGNETKALEILRTIFKVNTGRPVEEFGVKEITKDLEYKEAVAQLNAKKDNCAFDTLKSMWNQTVPLFKRPHLKNTFIACLIQFCIFLTSNGLYMFFPEILNRMADFMERNPGELSTVCQIWDSTKHEITKTGFENGTLIDEAPKCITELELSTYEHSFVLEVIYAMGFAVIGLIINHTGKLAIILTVLLGCGFSALALVLVNVPIVSIYLYIILLACGLAINVVNASTIDLFPTNLRAMAMCISLMFGRLGSVFGSNLVGLLLDRYCDATFLLSGITLLLSGILAFFIPNINRRSAACDLEKRTRCESMS